MNKRLTVADFFCGAGGFSEGFRQAGFNVTFALDNWEPARQTHKLNHPGCSHPGLDCHFETKGDILAIAPERINEIVPDTDVIIGSPPCVSFSSSNKAGKADKALGIRLVEKYLQIIAVKMHKHDSTLKYWLMENVPNLKKYIKQEYTFKMLNLDSQILRTLDIRKSPSDVALTIPISDMNIFNAVHYGVPQKRERFICGEFPMPSKKTPEKTEWVPLGRIVKAFANKSKILTDPNYGFVIPNEELTDHFYDTIIPKIEWHEAMIKKQQARYYGRMSFPEDESHPSRTIMATRSVLSRESMILPNGSPGNYRAPTVREAASIMSFPITYLFQGSNEATKYRLVGNSVCPKLSYALAEAILQQEGKRVICNCNPNSDRNKLLVDLRTQNPPKKIPRNKHPRANFAEIVPDLKHKNFRVELDNNMPRMNGNKILWSASVHHATGSDNMKKAVPKRDEILRVFRNYPDKSKIESFISDVHRRFHKNVPVALVFQSQHCNVKHDRKYLSPRQALARVKSIVNEHFPDKDFENCMLANANSPQRIIKFNHGLVPNNQIPLKMIAALYACNHIASLTRKIDK